MTISAKPNSTGTYQVLVYNKALHPDLFPLRDRRAFSAGPCQVEAWMMPGSHMVRYTRDSRSLCELVTDREDGLPTDGAVLTLPCAGERDFEHELNQFGLRYTTAVQTELLRENLYAATYDEMVVYADETDALMHQWDDGGSCLSVLDVQSYGSEFHVQSYHLSARGGLVLRSQTIFEHRQAKA